MAYDLYTKLLLHMDGASGSTTITDETGKVITNTNVTIVNKLNSITDITSGKTYYDGGHYNSDIASNAFDDNTSTAFQGNGAPDWVAIDFGTAKTIRTLRIKANAYGGNTQLKDFIFQSSNDSTNGNDGTWIDVYTGLHQNNTDWQEYTFNNPSSYRFYRIYTTTSYRTDYTGCSIAECEMSEEIPSSINCAYFNGSSHLIIPDSDDWYFGTQDFTIEGKVYPLAFGNYYHILSNYNSDSNRWFINTDSTGVFNFSVVINGTYYSYPATIKFSLNKWQHFAVVRNAGRIRLYLDGIDVTPVSDPLGTLEVPNFDGSLYVGQLGRSGLDHWNGYMDEIRICKGIAVWTGNFTPPTEPYIYTAPVTTYNTKSIGDTTYLYPSIVTTPSKDDTAYFYPSVVTTPSQDDTIYFYPNIDQVTVDGTIYIYDSVIADPLPDGTIYIYDSVVAEPLPDATVYVYDNVVETIYPANISLIPSIESTPSSSANISLIPSIEATPSPIASISLLPYVELTDYDSTIYLYFDPQYEMPADLDSSIYLYSDVQYEMPQDADSSIYMYTDDILPYKKSNNVSVTFF